MRIADQSIRVKILLIVGVVTGCALLLAAGAQIVYERHAAKAALIQEIGVLARIAADRSTAALTFNDDKVATETLAALDEHRSVEQACIYTLDGRLFAAYSRDDRAVGDCPALPMRAGHRFASDALELSEPVTVDDTRIGNLYIRSNLEAVTQRTGDYLTLVVITVLGAALFVAFAASRLQPLVSGPIRDLAETAGRITETRDYAVRAVKRGNDETGRLVDAFNSMLVTIGERDEELRRLNEKLEQRVEERTAELSAANQELEAFAYSVSHDLRAPLRTLSGFSQALKEDYAERLDEEGNRYLDYLQSGSREMGELIDGLLTLSRSTRGELMREPVDLSQMASQCIDELRKAEPERQVDVNIQAGMLAHCDRRLLHSVLENLLGNAWKYTNGTAQPRIEVGADRQGGEVWYWVKDNGVGFDMAYADKLFQPFQRLHRADEYPGTGIGLATVQRIVHRHGGRIRAEAGVGAGACLRFTLAPA